MIRSLIRSLRSRLIAAFAAIIFLTLTLVGIGFLVILREYQEQRELLRLGTLAGPVAFQLRALEQQGAAVPEVSDFLARQADELDVRIVLAGPQGEVFHDTELALVGRRIDVRGAQRYGSLRRGRLLTVVGEEGHQILLVAGPPSPSGSPLTERFLGRPGSYVVALVSEPLTYLGVVQEMAPRLLPAALLSLLASIGVAWLLAQSISRPLARMSRAAEEIARGRYDQQIATRGTDEVNRLATSFNVMAREVARSDRTLRDFVANVSHDLRTPLTSIAGFSQAIVDGAVRDRQGYVEAGRIIGEEAARMNRMVEDLLELSRIESGQAPLELVDVDLMAPVRRSAERAARQAAERGVELLVHIEMASAVRADQKRLERVFDNLLDNALEHTPPDGRIVVRVGVSAPALTMAVDDGGARAKAVQWATVEVCNTGSFIPAEDLPRIFERFYRVDKSRAALNHGSGLGLAIAQEIVQAHGGRIMATSAASDGTRLAVFLPRLDRTTAGTLRSGPGRRLEAVAGRLEVYKTAE